MKKIYIAIAAVFAVALTSCQMEEQAFRNEEFSPNTVVFGVGRAAGTKAAGPAVVSRQKISSMNDVEVDGMKLFLEETVTVLDGTPATKGTPAYTENVGTLYGSKLGVYATSLGDATYDKMDDALVGGGWRYQHVYASDPWPDESTAVDFYFRMPSDMAGIGTDGFSYTASDSLTISFSYTTPETASAQQDILFGARRASKADYLGSLPNGVPVLLQHALTGVKFAIAEDVKSTVMINSVTFSGIIDSGTCTVTPVSENGVYRDNITNFSSSATGTVVWSDTTRTGNTYSSAYTDIVTYEKNTAGSFDSAGDYPKSFANGGNNNNLDDADGNAAQTFWLIPQVLQNNTRLTINYTVKASPDATTGTTYEFTIDFGKTLKERNVEWKAGELHTYTLRVDAVAVHIQDEITSGGAKQGVVITNTGNTKAFIRATIIGNWCAENGEAVFGYTDVIDEPGEYVEIPSWTIEDNASRFVGLPGSGWVRATDGYFYYTTAVDPGADTGSALFTSYTPPTEHPDYQIAGKYVDSHFVMEIATQAVNANNLDGTTMSWQEAWAKALGPQPQPRSN